MAWSQHSDGYDCFEGRAVGFRHAEDCGPDTRAALKHLAWDHLMDTSPEGWMEF